MFYSQTWFETLGLTGNRGSGIGNRESGIGTGNRMCGIAGFVEFGNAPRDARARSAVLEAMANTLAQRGPDESTGLQWQGVSIAFRRLSINGIDGGSQPFHSRDGRISAFVNGELYNHAELRRTLSDLRHLDSGSDCEVLPDLFARDGTRAFERINGMFAAVVLDRSARELLLIRDRLGIKPLYYVYRRDLGRLIFGSELKALFPNPDVPRKFDWLAGLRSDYWPKPGENSLPSFFNGIQRVPSGSILRLKLDSGNMEVSSFWDLERAAAELEPPRRSEAPERFRELLADSVRYRIAADAGVGLFLSGGIDSVAIAALAAPHRRIPTFSVWNHATVASGDASASLKAAQWLDLPNDAVRIDGADAPMPDDWRNLLWACELISITAEQWYKFKLHAHARDRHPGLKVILLGQGADEFLGGYMEWLTGLGRPVDRSDLNHIEQALATGQQERAIAAADINPVYRALFRNGTLNADALDDGPVGTWRRYRGRYRLNLDYHLWHEDRTAAAHGIENRVPFLDHRLLEFVASIPESQQMRCFIDKRLLRDALAQTIPSELAHRRKGYFFYGPGELDAHRMIAQLLRAEDGVLLDQAVAGSQATGGPLTEHGLRALARQVLADPALRGLTPLMHLVNMGVLADLVTNAESTPPVRAGEPPAILDDRKKQEMLKTSVDLDADSILALSTAFSLLEIRRPGRDEAPVGTQLVAEGDELREEIHNPTLVSFLMRVDGRSSLAEITAEAGLNIDELFAPIRDALELGLLVRLH